MCLILFSYNEHPKYRLILAANRDEFYSRPTGEAVWRGYSPDVLAGIDHHAGGTWMGISECGRLAALTNYRNPADMLPHRASRGQLVCDYLRGGLDPDSYAGVMLETAGQYNGYNLLFGSSEKLCWFSNKTMETRVLKKGLFGLSNHLLDTPWPKVERGKAELSKLISADFQPEDIFSMLKDETRAPDDKLPDTGVGLDKERMLSPMFITSESYGTRCSTVLLIDRDGDVDFRERTYNKGLVTNVSYRFKI